MERYGIILGIYLNKDGRAAWLYDVTTNKDKKIMHFCLIDYFAYGHHSFHKDRLTQEKFTVSEEELYELVEHKKRYEEKWQFIGRVVKQGEYYQVV